MCSCGQIRGHRLSFRLVLAEGTAHWMVVFSVALTLLAAVGLTWPSVLLRGPPFRVTVGHRVAFAAVTANMLACGVRRADLPVARAASAGVLIIIEGASIDVA